MSDAFISPVVINRWSHAYCSNRRKVVSRSCPLFSRLPVLKEGQLPLQASQSSMHDYLVVQSERLGGWLTAHESTPASKAFCEQILLLVVALRKFAGISYTSDAFISWLVITRCSQVLLSSRLKMVSWSCFLISWKPVLKAEQLPLHASCSVLHNHLVVQRKEFSRVA